MRRSSRAPRSTLPLPERLPGYLTPLIGRSQELDELRELLRTRRLVSLVGAGGSGKTRLAAAVAAELQDRGRWAVWWVDLAPLSDPALVAQYTAVTLGLRDLPGRAAADSLVELIGHTPALLVLDNCEHLLSSCAVLADSLLRGCGSLRILTTSRQALGVAGEKAWLIPPLALPAAEQPAAESAAVQLFVQRANDALPTFVLTDANAEAVVRICRRLDGLPLAIELAAARVRLLPPEHLARRLDDVFGLLTTGSELALPRHRTLRALIDWSYDLLDSDERLLFERLAVFSGGFTLEAAECVIPDEALERRVVLDLLAALVDRSLLVMREWHGEARYSFLETVRQYAQERLSSAGAEGAVVAAEPLRLRHVRYFAALAEEASRRLHGTAQVDWLERLDAEHDNLRAALAWSVGAGSTELALRLCLGLRDFWRLRGHLSEGRSWLEQALRLPGAPDALRARVLVCAAVLGRMQGDHRAMVRYAVESEALARRVGDPLALADALTQLGVSLRERGELPAARERLEEAISLWRALGDARGLSLALGVRASVALAEGETASARALRLEAVEVSRGAGDPEGEALGLVGLGEVARLEGDYDGSRAYNERCLALFHSLGDAWHAAAVHHNLGWIAAETGRLEEAYHAFSDSVALFDPAGNPYGLTLCVMGLARVLHESGDSESAAIALASATAYTERVGVKPAAPADVAVCDRTRTAIESALDLPRLERAWAAGIRQEPAECIVWVQEKLASIFPRRARERARTVEPVAVRAAGVHGKPDPTTVTPDLRVQALGPLQIFLGDRPLEGDAFGSSKPRELLIFLLCNPDGCTREQVGLAFWPESSAAQVKNSYHVTLHRLRKALQHPEWIVTVGDRYRLDPALRVDFDAARFESEMEAVRRGGDMDERLPAALALYGGDFLEGELVGDWHLEIRSRLRRLYVDGLLIHGGLLLAAERFGEAAAAFRSVLARDHLHEEACRQLMVCHAQTGDRVQALRLYENLSILLDEELGTSPQETTRLLYESLQGAGPSGPDGPPDPPRALV